MWLPILPLLYTSAAAAAATAAAAAASVERQVPGLGSQSFKSFYATPPKLQISKSGKALAPGFLFFQPQKLDIKGGFIMSDDGELVYAGGNGTNFQIQRLNGKNVLSYWHGVASGKGFGYGRTAILDTTYTVLYQVCPQLGLHVPKFQGHTDQHTPQCQGDLHENLITDRGTVIVTAYNVSRHDLTSIGGPKNGWVAEGQFHEIDIKTNKKIFSWKSLSHIPVNKSPRRITPLQATKDTSPFDYFHINSVDRLNDGRYLVSARSTSSLYLIRRDGSIEWEFNGNDGGDFGPLPKKSDGTPASFGFQHDGRVKQISKTGMTITLFNNDNSLPGGTNPSAGMEFHLDTKKMSSTLISNFQDPLEPSFSFAEGNVQPLPNKNSLVGFGIDPIFKEFGPKGDSDVRMSVRFGLLATQNSYRCFRQQWHAVPTTLPTVVLQNGNGYVSWNGATDVTSYAVHSGSSKKSLKNTKMFKKTGFETQFAVPGGAKYLQVAAYQGKKLLRKSKVVRVSTLGL